MGILLFDHYHTNQQLALVQIFLSNKNIHIFLTLITVLDFQNYIYVRFLYHFYSYSYRLYKFKVVALYRNIIAPLYKFFYYIPHLYEIAEPSTLVNG